MSHLFGFARKSKASDLKCAAGLSSEGGRIKQGAQASAATQGTWSPTRSRAPSSRLRNWFALPRLKFRISGLIPWAVLGLFLFYVVGAAFRPLRSPEGFNLAGFGRLPVLLNGRVQPLDSVARNSLLQIRSTAAVPLEEEKGWQFWKHPRQLKSTEWLLEVLTKPDIADQRRVFLIHHPDLLGELDLKAAPGSGLNYYSFNELAPKLKEISAQAGRISEIKADKRSSAERQLMKLQNALVIYQRLKNSLQPNSFLQSRAAGKTIDYDPAMRLAEFQAALARAPARIAEQQGRALNPTLPEPARRFLQTYELVSRVALPLMIPPTVRENSRDGWENLVPPCSEARAQARCPRRLCISLEWARHSPRRSPWNSTALWRNTVSG